MGRDEEGPALELLQPPSQLNHHPSVRGWEQVDEVLLLPGSSEGVRASCRSFLRQSEELGELVVCCGGKEVHTRSARTPADTWRSGWA